MKKLGLICASLVMGISLAACSNSASQNSNKKSSSSSVTTKAVKHHKESKTKDSNSDVSENTNSSISSAKSSNSQNVASSNASSSQNSSDEDKLNKALNEPYKGYPSYAAYCEANGGDPDVQAETAKMQHDWNVKQGIENPDGSETQNFQNWVSQRDQAWDNGQDMPQYDQNTTY